MYTFPSVWLGVVQGFEGFPTGNPPSPSFAGVLQCTPDPYATKATFARLWPRTPPRRWGDAAEGDREGRSIERFKGAPGKGKGE